MLRDLPIHLRSAAGVSMPVESVSCRTLEGNGISLLVIARSLKRLEYPFQHALLKRPSRQGHNRQGWDAGAGIQCGIPTSATTRIQSLYHPHRLDHKVIGVKMIRAAPENRLAEVLAQH